MAPIRPPQSSWTCYHENYRSEAHLSRWQPPHLRLLKVETDQPGLHGWGEASLKEKPRAVAGCIEDMETIIRGEAPRRVEHCWQILYRSGFWRLGVIGLSALSGID